MTRRVSTHLACLRQSLRVLAAMICFSSCRPTQGKVSSEAGLYALTQMDKVQQSVVHILRKTRRATGVYRLIGLVGCLALLISIASPADDAVQHELALGRTRHVLRLLRANGPAAPLTRAVAILRTRIVPSHVSHRWIPVPASGFHAGQDLARQRDLTFTGWGHLESGSPAGGFSRCRVKAMRFPKNARSRNPAT